jgi:hypothetical protein
MLVCVRCTQPDLVDLSDLVEQGVEPLVAIRRLARYTA